MSSNFRTTHLFTWLNSQEPLLASRVSLIRDAATQWLSHITQLFPHYPSHAVDHSDRIVSQLSTLMFQKHDKSSTTFSPMEVYCLLCAAYLHDYGMVVSNESAKEILNSQQWAKFIGAGGRGKDGFEQYSLLKQQAAISGKEEHSFVANIALRRLVADFVRQVHHLRAKTSLEMHPYLRHLVDKGDPVTLKTVEQIGIAHGLGLDELTLDRFPHQTLAGERVDVLFLSHLLRIGDLLDLSTDRADHLAMEAVKPLPTDAIPHWKQYSQKTKEDISPKAIAFEFECDDAKTHQVLLSWFTWLADEVNALEEYSRFAEMHDDWRKPFCFVWSSLVNGSRPSGRCAPTIVIQPKVGVEYTLDDKPAVTEPSRTTEFDLSFRRSRTKKSSKHERRLSPLRGLHHINLPVRDLEISTIFYRDILKLTEAKRPPFGFPGKWFEIPGDQHQQIHLIPHLAGDDEVTFRNNDIKLNFKDVHIAIIVEDLDKIFEILQEHLQDAEIVKGPIKPAFQFYITDPDGHIIEFIDLRKLEETSRSSKSK